MKYYPLFIQNNGNRNQDVIKTGNDEIVFVSIGNSKKYLPYKKYGNGNEYKMHCFHFHNKKQVNSYISNQQKMKDMCCLHCKEKMDKMDKEKIKFSMCSDYHCMLDDYKLRKDDRKIKDIEQKIQQKNVYTKINDDKKPSGNNNLKNESIGVTFKETNSETLIKIKESIESFSSPKDLDNYVMGNPLFKKDLVMVLPDDFDLETGEDKLSSAVFDKFNQGKTDKDGNPQYILPYELDEEFYKELSVNHIPFQIPPFSNTLPRSNMELDTVFISFQSSNLLYPQESINMYSKETLSYVLEGTKIDKETQNEVIIWDLESFPPSQDYQTKGYFYTEKDQTFPVLEPYFTNKDYVVPNTKLINLTPILFSNFLFLGNYKHYLERTATEKQKELYFNKLLEDETETLKNNLLSVLTNIDKQKKIVNKEKRYRLVEKLNQLSPQKNLEVRNNLFDGYITNISIADLFHPLWVNDRKPRMLVLFDLFSFFRDNSSVFKNFDLYFSMFDENPSTKPFIEDIMKNDMKENIFDFNQSFFYFSLIRFVIKIPLPTENLIAQNTRSFWRDVQYKYLNNGYESFTEREYYKLLLWKSVLDTHPLKRLPHVLEAHFQKSFEKLSK